MPKIQWAGLPPALRDHLFDRLRERKITAEDLYQLKTWRESDPDGKRPRLRLTACTTTRVSTP